MTVWRRLLVVPFGLCLMVVAAGMILLVVVAGPFALAHQMLEDK